MSTVWPMKSLADVCQIRPPKTEARRRISESDLVSFVPMEDLGVGQKIFVPTHTRQLNEVIGSYTYFADGDVLLAKITPCFENGKLGIAEALSNGIGFGSSEYFVFRPGNLIDKQWLYYFLSRDSFRVEGATSMIGAVGHKRVTKEFVEGCQVPLPPVIEQRRIVAVLDRAFEEIDTAHASAEKNFGNARELFDSYLNSVFVQKGKKWVVKRLEDTVEKTCSLSYGIVQPGEDVKGGLPIVRPTDLQSRIVGMTGLKRIDPALADGYKRTKLHGGELLLCVRGGTGSVSIAAEELTGSNVTRGIVPIRFDESIVLQKFGYFAFISKGVQDQIRAATYGAALMQINIRDLRKVSLNLPPLVIQKDLLGRFVDISAEVERLASIYQQKVSALVKLKQAILQKAFAGELTAQSAEAAQEAAE